MRRAPSKYFKIDKTSIYISIVIDHWPFLDQELWPWKRGYDQILAIFEFLGRVN